MKIVLTSFIKARCRHHFFDKRIRPVVPQKRYNRLALVVLLGGILAFAGTGCSSYKSLQADTAPAVHASRHREVQEAIARFKHKDPSLHRFFHHAHGYAMIPSVAKGGFGIGGAHGKGEVYERGRLVGHTSLTQGTIGFQLGRQVYSQIIFFKDQMTLDNFKRGNLAVSAQVSAVAATAGAPADADFEDGVAVFTLAKGGLMYEAFIGGQKFS